ncbi:MAG: TonB-dependent receptor domain-containing protein [Sphingobium sp.]
MALCSLLPAAAFAQEPLQATTGEASPEQQGGLQEIIVTAQRRAESAQTVPIAVAAFTAEGLSASRTLSSDDLPGLVAGLTVAPNGPRTPLYLRGVGNNNSAASPAVLTFIDGVYMPFNIGAQAFNDVASMEIAKGPQGTLFGRNATGGVIQIITKDPTSTPSADMEIGYGNYDTVSAKAYVASGLTSNLRLGVAAFYENQMNGWGTNTYNGSEFFRTKKYGGRAKFVLDVSDTTTIKLAADYSYGFGNHGTNVNPRAGENFTFSPVTQTKQFFTGKYDVNADLAPYFTTKEGGLSLTVNSKLGELNLLSISSWRKNKNFLQIDYDGTPVNSVNINRYAENTAYSQELQISSPSNGSFKWVAGLFYFHEAPKVNPFIFFGPGMPFVFGTPADQPLNSWANDKGNAYAGYGQASLEVLPGTTLTLGARYTIEKRSQRGFNDIGGFVIPGSEGGQSKTFKKPTFRASVDHKFSPDLMIYASFNRGFNSGWFNTLALGGFSPDRNPVIQPETIDAYEIGFKSQLFDRKLRINVAAFQYNYTNLQLQFFELGGLVTKNAAGARIRGVDIDIQARPVKNIDLAVSAEFLDPKFTDYPDAPFYQILPSGELAVTDSRDASGFSTTQAPHFSLNASISHRLETSIGTFQSTAGANYRGATYADTFEQFPLRKRTLINLTERWESSDGQLSASLWMKNLLNERYDEFVNLVTPVAAAGQAGAPRTYGITLGYRFGN